MTESTIYWITRMDNIVFFFCAVTVILLLIGGLFLSGTFASVISEHPDEEEQRTMLKLTLGTFGAGLVTMLFTCFIPTTKEAAAMYILPRIANSEFVQNDLPKEARELYELVKEYVKKEVEK